MKTIAIGLTGGIGSGKSTIAHILCIIGYPVYIADTEASRLMNTHPEIRREIISYFGESFYEQNQLNKPMLAKLIFEDTRALAIINSIVHPRVMEDFKQWSKKQTNNLVFFESAILFEAELNHFFKRIVCVTAPQEIRIQRVISRDNTSQEQILHRIRHQMDDSTKCKQADFIIFNDNHHMVIEQILNMVEKLKLIPPTT